MKNRKGFKIALMLIAVACLAACGKSESKPEPSLSVSSAEVLFAATGGTNDVNITCNTQWSVANTALWCTASSSANSGNGKISLTVQANPNATERTATISVTAGTIVKEIRIRQFGKTIEDNIPSDQTGMRNISAIDLAKDMKIGWNVGNSLEAIGGETAWGNPKISQRLIDSIQKAGFNAVRIPIAWSKFSDASTFKIETSWMDRVEEVVNYVLNKNMYAIINIHWDNGWMQPTNAQKDYVNNRLAVMWKQIAIRFRNYDDHLLFAGTNEVMVTGDYSAPKPEYYNAQNSFNQTFVTAVRATGGRNTYRNLVVQGFNTNIDYTVSYFQTPTDPTSQRLMVEVHYYDPYNFSLNENSTITQWGKDATNPAKTETWANEAYADAQFQKMKTKFIDKGYPVILGEYGALARLNLGSAAANSEYAGYRKYYMEYITKSAVEHGLIPFYWDNGPTGDKSMGLFNRSTGEVAFPDIVKAITGK